MQISMFSSVRLIASCIVHSAWDNFQIFLHWNKLVLSDWFMSRLSSVKVLLELVTSGPGNCMSSSSLGSLPSLLSLSSLLLSLSSWSGSSSSPPLIQPSIHVSSSKSSFSFLGTDAAAFPMLTFATRLLSHLLQKSESLILLFFFFLSLHFPQFCLVVNYF